MTNSEVTIIAEAGVNHNGDLAIAKELCNAAKEAGANCVKFQTYLTEDIVTQQAALTTCQIKNSSISDQCQFEMLKKLELSYENFHELKLYCDQIKIAFMSTPDEAKSLHFLSGLGVKTMKIGSGELSNLPFLREVAALASEIIISTGMSTLDEIGLALEAIQGEGFPKEQLTVLHCTSAYPTPLSDVNLRAMIAIRDAFDLRVGYSDHTTSIEVPLAAVAMGAQVLEKHFTLDRTLPGPDHITSIEPDEFREMVNSIRRIELAFGDGVKRPMASELHNREIVRKSVVAKGSIASGERFTSENITVKRPGGGIAPGLMHLLIGKLAKKSYDSDEHLLMDELE